MSEILRSGSYLQVGEYLQSNNKRFIAVMQSDGHFCVYRGQNLNNLIMPAVWAPGKYGANNSMYFSVMQDDGNFVVYEKDNEGKPIYAVWCTETQGKNYSLLLRDDGNLVVQNQTGKILWISGNHRLYANEFLREGEFLVSPSKRFFAFLQADAHFVIYKGSNPNDNEGYIWGSGSIKTNASYFAYQQSDGNFVIYKGKGPGANKGVVWATDSNLISDNNCFLQLQDDGNLCIYDSHDQGIWDARVFLDHDFIPSIHGWPFGNSYSYKVQLPVIGKVTISSSFGLCGGMCQASLDRYKNNQKIPRNLNKPAQGTNLYNEFMAKQSKMLFNNFMILKIIEWQMSPDVPHTFALHSLRFRTYEEWKKIIRGKLSNGKPVIICLIKSEGISDNITDNHVVIAHSYYVDGDDLRIWIYDPNYPNRNDIHLYLRLNQSENKSLKATQIIPGEANIPFRGFFHIAD